MIRSLTLILASLTLCPFVSAQTRPAVSQPGPETIRLKVHPAAEPRPALRWRLLPSAAERKPGNAATMYWTGFYLTRQAARDEHWVSYETPEEAAKHPDDAEFGILAQVPVASFPLEQARARLDQYMTAGRYSQFEVAAWREYCRWDLPQGIEAVLPHLNEARWVVTLLALKAKVQMAEGDIGGAIRTLEIITSLAKDLDEEAVLVQGLVGAGIEAMALKQVESLIQMPDGPNLYWALAHLPRPFFNLARMVQRDREQLTFTFPLLHRDLDRDPLTPEQWRSFMAEISRLAPMLGRGSKWGGMAMEPAVYAMIAYPEAKEYLIARGRTHQQVEAMNAQTIVAKWLVGSFVETCDAAEKWFALPAWQQYDGVRRTSQALQHSRPETKNVLIATVVSDLNRIPIPFGKVDRRIAMLQTIEALRGYAASHQGKLPAALSEMTDMPAPIDPTTGKPFAYRAEGQTAILESPAAPGDHPRWALRYEVTIEE